MVPSGSTSSWYARGNSSACTPMNGASRWRREQAQLDGEPDAGIQARRLGSAVERLAAQRERHQRRADRARHRQALRDPAPRRQRDAQREALLADGDRRQRALGRGEDAGGRRDAQPPPAHDGARASKPNAALVSADGPPSKRAAAARSIHRSAAPRGRRFRRGDRHLRGGAARTPGAGAGGSTGGLSASAMNTAAARARSSQSRAGSAYCRVCPSAVTEKPSPSSITFGDVRGSRLRFVAQGRRERRRHRLRAGTRAGHGDGRGRRCRGDQAEQQGRAHATTAVLTDFCPTASSAGVS